MQKSYLDVKEEFGFYPSVLYLNEINQKYSNFIHTITEICNFELEQILNFKFKKIIYNCKYKFPKILIKFMKGVCKLFNEEETIYNFVKLYKLNKFTIYNDHDFSLEFFIQKKLIFNQNQV